MNNPRKPAYGTFGFSSASINMNESMPVRMPSNHFPYSSNESIHSLSLRSLPPSPNSFSTRSAPAGNHRSFIFDNIHENQNTSINEMSCTQWIPVSKCTVVFLMLYAIALFADTIQMVLLYVTFESWVNLDVVIYGVFPFLCFILVQMSLLILNRECVKFDNNGYSAFAKF